MTPKAEALIDGLLDACIDSDNISADYQALVAYIEELERKAAYHDRLMAMQTEERTPGPDGVVTLTQDDLPKPRL